MSTQLLPKFRRKKRRKGAQFEFIPYPKSLTNLSSFTVACCGSFSNGKVTVENEKEARKLYALGYFGKFTTSSRPENLFARTFDNSESEEEKLEEQPIGEETSSEKGNMKLVLLPEEAFFLAYGLGCLKVHENDKVLELSKLWESLCKSRESTKFMESYISYHYFRSKGWVVTPGIKYGVHWLLYKDGPSFFHSTYAVILNGVDASLESKSQKPSWRDLAAVIRVLGNVAKELLICNVIYPDLPKEEILSPESFSKFKVEVTLIERWVPSEAKDDDKSVK